VHGRKDNIKVGIAGWSYPDWKGVVYPSDRNLSKLKLMARFFRTIEINSTFYRIPPVRMVELWCREVEPVEDFIFTVKLLQDFTHAPPESRLPERDFAEKAKAVKESLRPLEKENRLGAMLVQFPYSFHLSSNNLEYMKRLFDEFQGIPLVVEVRHRSFENPEFYAFLREQGVGWVNIDQPQVSYSVRATSEVTAPMAYVRFHGRNAEAWFDADSTRETRYDYDYSQRELSDWIHRVEKLSGEARVVYAIFNNHFRGQEVANALEFMYLWTEKPVAVPPLITKTYPRLKKISSDMASSKYSNLETLPLFPED
jgi:uncharacterized protein YecE (DUF72 family)